MRLKTFFAPTMGEAMASVRRDLGGEALIISSLEEKDGVRLTVAIESNASLEPKMTSLCEGFFEPDRVLSQFSRCLSHHGVPDKIKDNMLLKVSENQDILQKGLIHVFDHLFRYCLSPFEKQDQALLMLVGLTGAGKSVTTAKLAAEALLSGQQVELVTLDVHKAGAFEQLSSYASIMNVPLHVAKTPSALAPFVEKKNQGIQIIIDTPGVNPFSQDDMAFLSECILTIRQAPYWIMPAGGDAFEILEAAEAFKNIGVTGFFQTRSDSVRRHGALLAAMGESDLRLSGLSMGPTVGSRLVKADGEALHTLLDGDKFKDQSTVSKIKQTEKPKEPEWLVRLREAKA